MKRVLLIEDEAGLALTLTDLLGSEGFEVHHEADGSAGHARAVHDRFDVIVLDLMLPNKSGLDICRDLRAHGIVTPILMLTARGELTDKVIGLKMGADDYLTKPFEGLELLARLEALLRRGQPISAGGHVHRFGEIVVDLRRAEVTRAGVSLDLSAREYQLLAYFLEHRGTLLSRDRLMDEVWGYDAGVNTRTVDVTIANLRRKIEPAQHRPRFIQTVHGLGYRFRE